MSTFIISYSPTDNVNIDGAINFFGNDIAIFGKDFVEALDHLHNPRRCPDCMSKDVDYSDPLMPACKICKFAGTLNKFQPAVNILTHIILQEPLEPGGRQFFLYGNIGQALQDFERIFAEMEVDMELIFDTIEDKESFWNSIFKPEAPKGEVLCLTQ